MHYKIEYSSNTNSITGEWDFNGNYCSVKKNGTNFGTKKDALKKIKEFRLTAFVLKKYTK